MLFMICLVEAQFWVQSHRCRFNAFVGHVDDGFTALGTRRLRDVSINEKSLWHRFDPHCNNDGYAARCMSIMNMKRRRSSGSLGPGDAGAVTRCLICSDTLLNFDFCLLCIVSKSWNGKLKSESLSILMQRNVEDFNFDPG
jgi:hypothetical protein